MLRRIAIGVVAALFGCVLISTGKAVYDIGVDRLREATEEMCLMVGREKRNCSYECGGLLSDYTNCTGHSYRYTAVSEQKCGKKQLVYDEFLELKDKGITMCRCGDHEKPGDCWVDLPGFLPNKTYPCTVQNSCNTFDLSSPTDYETTGEVNIVLGVFFLIFSCCPETCVYSVSVCIDSCINAIGPLMVACVDGILTCTKRWLVGVRNFTAAPARGYVSDNDELQPLL
eukprot:TRINITY_DN23553_c0_g1_i1.p1 TRINITY_DN23553_c0_g1~~TRINITY_DN23553_c0_g1_i1.p1  ORF type:complete len:228 (+),score=35.62 TRINITY_DN23553_c0_g1_i1:61-744(+)